MKTILSTADAPAAIGPYSQAVRSGEALYCSGQLGIDPATGKLPEGVAAQTEQSLKNIRALLAAAGAGIENVVKTTVFITNMGGFPVGQRGILQSIRRESSRPFLRGGPRNCPSAGWLKSKCSPSSDSRNAPGSANVRSK